MSILRKQKDNSKIIKKVGKKVHFEDVNHMLYKGESLKIRSLDSFKLMIAKKMDEEENTAVEHMFEHIIGKIPKCCVDWTIYSDVIITKLTMYLKKYEFKNVGYTITTWEILEQTDKKIKNVAIKNIHAYNLMDLVNQLATLHKLRSVAITKYKWTKTLKPFTYSILGSNPKKCAIYFTTDGVKNYDFDDIINIKQDSLMSDIKKVVRKNPYTSNVSDSIRSY